MIVSARWTSADGTVVDFNTNDIPFSAFTTECDVRFTEKSRSQRPGIHPGDTLLGKRLFHAEGDILADSSASYWEKRLKMVGALMPRPQLGYKYIGTLDLELSGVTEVLSSNCTIDGYPELPLDGASPARGRYQVNWKSFDPKLYGPYQSVDVAYNPGSQNIGGRDYNKVYPKIYSGEVIRQGDVIVTNSGNIETFPLLAFYGPCTDPEAIITRSDGRVYRFILTGVELADVTESAIIDMQARTVTRNNGTNLYEYAVGSDWWSLEPFPMTNTVKYRAGTIDVPSHMSVQWRNAYMI